MELVKLARLQGPRARINVLLLGLVGLLGGLAIAAARIFRDSTLDAGSSLWILFSLLWGAAFAAVELLANRNLRRAAVRDMPADADLVLFRVGQWAGEGQILGKGWIWSTDEAVSVWLYRKRTQLAHVTREDGVTASSRSRPATYAILSLAFGVNQSFECIPVEVGIHNLG